MANTLVLSSNVEELKSTWRRIGLLYTLTYTADSSSPGSATTTVLVGGIPFRIFGVTGGTKVTADTLCKIYHPKKASSSPTDLLDGAGKLNFASTNDCVVWESGSKPMDYGLYGLITIDVGTDNMVNSSSATLYLEVMDP